VTSNRAPPQQKRNVPVLKQTPKLIGGKTIGRRLVERIGNELRDTAIAGGFLNLTTAQVHPDKNFILVRSHLPVPNHEVIGEAKGAHVKFHILSGSLNSSLGGSFSRNPATESSSFQGSRGAFSASAMAARTSLSLGVTAFAVSGRKSVTIRFAGLKSDRNCTSISSRAMPGSIA
jgi:hypothetical protein